MTARLSDIKPWERWSVIWRSDCALDDGPREYLVGEGGELPLFRTRREARYGYIRTRPDLHAEPHGWKMPIPVRVTIGVAA